MKAFSKLVQFEHNGIAIVNPFLDELGITEVVPEYYGFELVKTGEDTSAWFKRNADGSIIAVSEQGRAGVGVPSMGNANLVIIWQYKDEATFYNVTEGENHGNTLAEAILAQRLFLNTGDPDLTVRRLVNDALDMAVAHIHKALGVTTGDFAGRYFSNNIVQQILEDYAEAEAAE